MDSFMMYTEPFVVTGGGPGSSTQTLSILLTTIAIGQFDDDEVSSSEMSEEDIERQISEIRQAILRSNEDPQGGTA
jgi:hypothetical protein